MPQKKPEPYWVLTGEGDPLPFGSGLRRVLVTIGRKWVTVRPAAGAGVVKIKLATWENFIGKTPDVGDMRMSEILDAVRPMKRKCKGRHCQL